MSSRKHASGNGNEKGKGKKTVLELTKSQKG